MTDRRRALKSTTVNQLGSAAGSQKNFSSRVHECTKADKIKTTQVYTRRGVVYTRRPTVYRRSNVRSLPLPGNPKTAPF